MTPAGFDIRGHLGDLLAPKFKFSGIDGISRAYQLFDLPASAQEALSDAKLLLLEKTRHLVVHKGAIVDTKFKRETGVDQKPGTELHISGGEVNVFSAAVIRAAAELIAAVDGWLARDSQ